jgi:hypothetical protein
VKGVNGACIEVQRQRAVKQTGKKKKGSGRTRCGSDSNLKVTAHDRKPNLVKEAQGHFMAAIKLWKKGAAATLIASHDSQRRSTSSRSITETGSRR